MIVGEPLMEPTPMLMTGYLSTCVYQVMTTPSQTQPLRGLSLPDSGRRQSTSSASPENNGAL